MNYIGLLTKEEKSILCGIITGKEFKELFKRNEQEFSKIRKGFRAKSLTEQQALSIAISNIDKPFIATWVNIMVEHWLKEIQENIAKLEGEGLSHRAALATTMLDSFFVNNVELYFKLTDNPLDADAYSNLYERMENIKSERARNAEISDRIKAVEQENRSLSDQVEAAQRSMDAIKTECEERVQEIEQSKNELESLLAEAQAKIAELQTAPSAFTNDDADYLPQFDDTNTSILPSGSADEIISLCGVTTDYGGQKRLVRCADLNHNGQYSIFRKDDNISDDFTNWYKISHRDGPSHDGFYGTWIAADVEKAVAVRIQKARENAAEFIASMAFVSGQQIQVGCTESPAKIEVSSKSDIDTYRICPEYDNLDDLEVHHSWTDVINTAVFELAEAGVAEQYRSGLAAFLCAAYIKKQPLLLVGPNAIDIIQAFSAAVTAHKHGVLCCEGGYAHQAVEKIGADGESIVIINNFLASGWINRIPEILYKKDVFYVFTHPYAEDIQVEPKSLYGFMLPLFTEFLVDKKATGKYYGGYFSDDFKSYSPEKGAHKELSVLSKFALSSLVRSKINSLAATMHGIYPMATADDDFLFCVFPIAYASMAVNELAEEIADSQKGIAVSASLKRDLQHVLGEI